MIDLKSKIMKEAEQSNCNVIAVSDAMEKCPTLSGIIKAYSNIFDGMPGYSVNFERRSVKQKSVCFKGIHPFWYGG